MGTDHVDLRGRALAIPAATSVNNALE